MSTDLGIKASKKLVLKANVGAVKATLVEYCLNVKFDGLGKVFSYENKLLKLLWLSIFLLFSGLTAWLVALNIADYFTYEIITKIEVVNERPATFPTLTICDNNPFPDKEGEKIMFNVMNELYGKDIENSSSFIDNYLRIKNVTEVSKLKAWSSLTTDTKKLQLSKTLSSIRVCKFNKVDCDLKNDMNPYYSYDYGNCLQFNGESNHLKNSLMEGVEYGFQVLIDELFLTLYGSINKYPSTNSKGLILFVHNQSQSPSSSDGIYLQPGTDTYISVERTFTFNQPSPFSQCQDMTSIADTDIYYFIKNSNQMYKQSDCLNLCLQKLIIETCGCYFPKYGMIFKVNSCMNQSQLNCIVEQSKKYISESHADKCLNVCPIECDSIKYDTQVSTLDFPNEQLLTLLKNSYPSQNFDNYKDISYSLNVFYPYLDYTRITQSPKTLPIDLISQIGGSLGMLLSISLFHLLEFFEILCVSVMVLFKRN
jgi:hypothetical protein